GIERPAIGASIVEHAENPGEGHASAPGEFEEAHDRRGVVVADHLRQKEFGAKVRIGKVLDLALRLGVGLGPTAARSRLIAFAQELPELPRMLHAARRSDAAIAAEHDERPKTVLARPFRV